MTRFFLRHLILAFSLTMMWAATAQAGCGRGCQKSMGSCTVPNLFWNAAKKVGIRMTSCCRSKAYTEQMRRCGYTASRRSYHLTGKAVDFAGRSHSSCAAIQRKLRAQGIQASVSLHNGNHCHAVYRNGSSVSTAERDARSRARGIRDRNRNRSRNASYTPRYRKNSYASSIFRPRRAPASYRTYRPARKYWTRNRLKNWRVKMRNQRRARHNQGWNPFRSNF